MDEDLLSIPIRFIPRAGPDAEWPPVPDWTDADWEHWLLEHNKYPFLRQWTHEEIGQYLIVDRFKYGFGLRRKGSGEWRWFYLPSPVAIPFHSLKIPNILFGGAAGGTKSQSARWDALRHAFAIPQYRGIIMRRTFEELKQNHTDKLESEVAMINDFVGEQIMQYVDGDHECRVYTHGPGQDAKILFGHCQHVGDENKYLGPSYDGFYPDEAATFEKQQIIGVAGRLRSEKRFPNGGKVIASLRAASNPGGAHTLWLKEYFIDKLTDKIREQNPRYNPFNYHFIKAMLWDNAYYMDPDGTYTSYEDRLFEYDPERRRQLLMGDWSALAGQFFPEFNEARHVTDALTIPAGCKIERWVDWGYSPHYGMCLWVACLPDGRLYVFYEWKFNGEHAKNLLVASDVATYIDRLTKDEIFPLIKGRRITKSIADPHMWSGDGHSGEDYAETFRKNKVALLKGDNERVMGWGRFRAWLRLAPDGKPWLMFHPRCVTCIRTIPGLVRDKSDLDDVDTTGEDHGPDAIRYGVMARPSPTVLRLPAILIPDGTPLAIMNDLRNQNLGTLGMVS